MKDTETTFPAGTVRHAVARAGDSWQGYIAAGDGALADRVVVIEGRVWTADSVLMLKAEQVRCAGATPAQRESWAQYVAACKNKARPGWLT